MDEFSCGSLPLRWKSGSPYRGLEIGRARGFGAPRVHGEGARRLLSALRATLAIGLLALFSAAPAFAQSAEYVIHISVDGLNASELEALIEDDPDEFDSFKRLVDEGASTFNARTDYFYTVTLPNHTSMITGRPVSQPLGQANTVHHGYTSNSTPGSSDTLHNSGNPNLSYVVSVFDVVHDAGLSTAFYASKSKFVLYEQSYNASSGAPDTNGSDDGPDKIDSYVNRSNGSPSKASRMHNDFLDDMEDHHFNYSWVNYRDPDSAGHDSGWGGSDWDDSVEDVDDYIGEILELIEEDELLDGNTIIILTSDHGGIGTGHSSSSSAANYTIPYFVWGNGIEAGSDLYALNAATRLDPGTDSPSYDEALQPIRNVGSGNLALSFLGLPAVSGSTINNSQNLRASFPSAVCGNGSVEAGEQCDGGSPSAGDCCSDACQFEAGGSACGEGAASACDAADSCDGNGVCLDNFSAAGILCRAAAGDCDLAETCDGFGVCPADAFAAPGVSCGDAADQCTFADSCNGAGACTDNGFFADGTSCSDGNEATLNDQCGAGVCMGSLSTVPMASLSVRAALALVLLASGMIAYRKYAMRS